MAFSHQSLVRSPFIVISERGFLPPRNPSHMLAEEDGDLLNVELNLIIEQLPRLLRQKTLRAVIDELNKKHGKDALIKLNKFDHGEVNHAFLVLTMLMQAYIWEDAKHPVKMIPRILSQNIFELLRFNPRVPVLTYSDYVLNNWRLIDKDKPITLENIEPLFTFTGSEEEAWFIKIHVAIEAAFGLALRDADYAYAQSVASDVGSKERIARCFACIAKSTQRATEILGRMYEHCSPAFFFNELRPYLEGTDKVQGLRFDYPSSWGWRRQVSYRGSSGAQSSVLPALDAILNVKHDNDAMTKTLHTFLDYMPNEHRGFILRLRKNKIQTLLNEKDLPERVEAINQLWLFRKKHLDMPAQYIMLAAVEKGKNPKEITGTGSTNVGMFLAKRADNTLETAERVFRAKL